MIRRKRRGIKNMACVEREMMMMMTATTLMTNKERLEREDQITIKSERRENDPIENRDQVIMIQTNHFVVTNDAIMW